MQHRKIIKSRADGTYKLNVTPTQLELLSKLLCATRLGSADPYREAAYELIAALEKELGYDFIDNASQKVLFGVTISDSHGEDVFSMFEGTIDIALEIQESSDAY